MNSTVSENQTFFLVVACANFNPGYLVQLSVMELDLTILLPIQIWVLWLGISNVRIKRRLAASEIFTMNLSALEVLVIKLYFTTNVACAFYYQNTTLLVILFPGSYLVGRPFMNCLICVEHYMAVAQPVIYRNPAFVKHRYIGARLVWLASVVYGGLAVSTHLSPAIEVYILSLIISLLLITACSPGKILLRPSPGETQKDRMHRQKKRAFVIITVILVCISVPHGMEIFQFIMKKYLAKDTFGLLVGIQFLDNATK